MLLDLPECKEQLDEKHGRDIIKIRTITKEITKFLRVSLKSQEKENKNAHSGQAASLAAREHRPQLPEGTGRFSLTMF